MRRQLAWLLMLVGFVCGYLLGPFVPGLASGQDVTWNFVVTEDVQEPPPAAAPAPQYELHVFGATWCGPCQAYKRQMPALQKVLPVVQHDVDREPQWRKPQASADGTPTFPAVRVLPTVWLLRTSDRKIVEAWTGPVGPAAVGAALSRQKVSG
jgi:thiol-disulfide isomerase/thioredoxin